MPEPAPQRRKDLWTTVLFSLLMLGGIAMIALGVVAAAQGGGFTTLAIGVVALVVPASMVPLIKRLGEVDPAEVRRQTQLLDSIAQRLSMSDLQRRMVDRQRDREHLRQAILDDIRKEDYEAALALVEEMADQFGYVEEAEKYRQQIIDARARHREQAIGEAVERVRELCSRYDWTAAKREVDRLGRLYPEDGRITALPRMVQEARDERKRALERQFLHAAKVPDTDKAMTLLKELDMYLTPAEAEAYHETARGVIGQARENTAVRFRMAVSDRDWIEAMKVGEQIIREFPNSKMADEVRDMMDVLRERAAGQKAAEANRSESLD
jgi:tetratricopeptide (TPR) repeat protein